MGLFHDLKDDQRAQATLEYILVLTFVVMIFLTVVRVAISPLFAKLSTSFTQTISNMYSSDNLHRLMFKIGK